MLDRRDFVIRLIEQFASFLAKTIARLAGLEFEAAKLDVEAAYSQYLGLSPDFHARMPVSLVIDLFRTDPSVFKEKCLIFAELLNLETRVLEAAGEKEKSEDRRKKALQAYAVYLSEQSSPDSEIVERARLLFNGGRDLDLPEEIMRKLRQL